jgi:dihydropteroate synthase
MHSRGDVAEMATYRVASYEDVVDEVLHELRARVDAAREAGVDDETLAAALDYRAMAKPHGP